MSSFELVLLVGYLGKDPEMRYTPQGTAVTTFSMATDREYTKNDEKVKETTWWRVQTWGKSAEACNEYLRKGSLVAVEGRMSPNERGNPRIWTNKSGEPQALFEVNAKEVKFLRTDIGGRSARDTEESF
jgi:single-strand DNA-binding protein